MLFSFNIKNLEVCFNLDKRDEWLIFFRFLFESIANILILIGRDFKLHSEFNLTLKDWKLLVIILFMVGTL